MRNSERSRHIAAICAVSVVICMVLMCLQVDGDRFSARVENDGINDVIYTNAEIPESLSLKEKLAEDSSLWGRLARALLNMVEP